jgi:hypothetical protein
MDQGQQPTWVLLECLKTNLQICQKCLVFDYTSVLLNETLDEPSTTNVMKLFLLRRWHYRFLTPGKTLFRPMRLWMSSSLSLRQTSQIWQLVRKSRSQCANVFWNLQMSAKVSLIQATWELSMLRTLLRISSGCSNRQSSNCSSLRTESSLRISSASLLNSS